MSIERDGKIDLSGGLITKTLRQAYARGGFAAAKELVENGLSDEEILAVCSGDARLIGSTATQVRYVEEAPRERTVEPLIQDILDSWMRRGSGH